MKSFFPAALVLTLLVAFNFSVAQNGGIASAESKSKSNASANLPLNKTEQELRKITRELTSGDVKIFDKYMAANYVFTGVNGEVIARADIRKNFRPPLAILHESTDFEEFKLVEYANTAVMIAKVNYTSEIAGQKVTQSYRATDIFTKQAAQWKILSRHLTIIPNVKVEVKIDPAIYDSYVGQYEFAPGLIYNGLKEADKLLVQAPDGSKLELLPVNDSTFYIQGQLSQVTYVKDDAGKVSHVNYRLPDGQVVKIKKIK